MHDLREPNQGRLTGQPPVLDQHVERALAVAVGVLGTGRVVGVGAFPAGGLQNLIARDVQELGFDVDEPPDEPRARDTVDVCVLTCYPLHAVCSFVLAARVDPSLDRRHCWLFTHWSDCPDDDRTVCGAAGWAVSLLDPSGR